MVLAQSDLIRIEEVPVWALVPFGVVILVALAWSVAWILRAPESPTPRMRSKGGAP